MIEALAVGGWLFGCAVLGLQAIRASRSTRRGRIVPTRAQPRSNHNIVLDDNILSPRDRDVLRSNEDKIILAYQFGLDVALHRAGKSAEFLCAGESPSASAGFVVVRNGDA